ncbi:potassium channel subfamily K member 2 [Aplysia californica]|uniref:Potassium channel subfamily K member 2 n=1 Tax=Aplysia californica TaxID=6500 RepID=A0ABM0JIN4_APLCA|nr:potassium channel subfamily K member 2 [Aplysia californica]XP_005094520.1 potassium channel subfamily K member 2 [Aplysia californica]XP_012935806.1 potassium channel subfamily K member 2 [Aplysia californica]
MGTQQKDSCCKMVMKFLFSHVGLCAMVILYCVAGGFIFEHLEKNNEEQICYESRSEYSPMEEKTINSTLKIFYDYGGAITTEESRRLMTVQLKSVLETFRNNTLAIGYDGRSCNLYGQANGPVYEWSWAGGLMFSVTVISTIGYGHIAPKTVWGRLVCIAYAVLGIPLMLLCLANIGDVLADIFRFIYARICCCGCFRKKKKDKDKVVAMKPSDSNNTGQWESDKSKIISGGQNAPANSDFSRLPTRSPTESLETGDSGKQRLGSASSRTSSRTGSPNRGKVKIVPLDVKKNDPVILDDDSDSEDEDDLDEKKITVPLTITMIVIGGYIFGGAVLFGLWEGWDWLQSAYFCFITLSTIGFGDVVPGTDFENPQAQAQLLLGSVYVLFGMAILSMCFSLMQDEILAKARWIGQKLGILDKDADD